MPRNLVALLLCCVAMHAGEQPPEGPIEIYAGWHTQARIVIFATPGRVMFRPPPVGTDPIAPLAAEEDAAKVATWGATHLKNWQDAYVERVRIWFERTAKPSAEFLAWLDSERDLRRDFLLALHWRYDDPAAAAGVLDGLRREFPKQIVRFSQLAIAMAVVHDHPDAVLTSRYDCIFGMAPTQFSEPQTPSRIFAWFTDDKRQRQLVFKPDQLPWPVLIHLVDLDLSPEECAWVMARPTLAKDLAALYPSVPYDDSKNPKSSKLGSKPYTLENLLQFGGVCGDQAHYASRFAKVFGVPAMKASGMGRYGGAGHAWCGFLVAAKGRPLLEFTGRYFNDYYYSGRVFEPQTRTTSSDHNVAQVYDAMTRPWPKVQLADTLARASVAVSQQDPGLALVFARKALDANDLCADAWRTLCRLGGQGALPRPEVEQQLKRLFKVLAAHPDLTFECVQLAIDCVPEAEVAARLKLWNAAFALYAQRPDLQIALRCLQHNELVGAGNSREAMSLALETIVANAKEGGLILPLVDTLVRNALKFAKAGKPINLGYLKEQLAKADAQFPKKRGNETSESYRRFREMVDLVP